MNKILLALLIYAPFAVAKEDNPQKTMPSKITTESTGITSPLKASIIPAFDLIHAHVQKKGDMLIFQLGVTKELGKKKPTPVGKLAGSEVYSYVWPTTLNSSDIGFDADKGIVALAITSHPDFDDTPKYDENKDGNLKNDGGLWHSHWVVLVKDKMCPGGLKVRDIPKGAKVKTPITWPELPIYIDSPGYHLTLSDTILRVDVPSGTIENKANFKFDAVTAVLQVNESIHSPLLCVTNVQDIASGDLSLPGKVEKK